MSDHDERLRRALRLEDDDNTLKVRALPNGLLLFEISTGDGGYEINLLLDAEREGRLRVLLDDRQAAREDIAARFIAEHGL